jgi:hypothetical protein
MTTYSEVGINMGWEGKYGRPGRWRMKEYYFRESGWEDEIWVPI